MKKFIDLGTKYPAIGSPEKAVDPKKPHVSYPYLSLTSKEPIGGKVGKVMTAQVKLRLQSASIDKTKDGNTHRESFDVMGIAPGTMSGESSVEELMEDDTDGGRMNLQSVIDGGLKEESSKHPDKKPAKKTGHLKQYQFKKRG